MGRRQLWTDEIMQAMILRASTPNKILTRLKYGMALPAPLDYFIQKGVVLLLGESTWALRLHAAILGSLSLWIFYRVSNLMFGGRVAVYSTILFALYPLHYHYSQEGRPYALLVFLTLVSYELLLRIVMGRIGGAAGWLWLTLVQVMLLYASFLGMLVLLSQAVALILSASWGSKIQSTEEGAITDKETREIPKVEWPHVARYVLVAAVACATFVPWIRFAFTRPFLAGAGEVANPKLVLRLIKELGDNSYPMAGLLIVGVVTGLRALRLHRRNQSLIWLVSWAALSVPAVILLELWSGYFFAIRHILHTTPALLLLAGYGLFYAGERLTLLERLPYRASAPALFYMAITLLGSVWIATSHWRREPVDWAGVAMFLEENARPGDALAMPQIHDFLEYYSPSLAGLRVDEAALESGAYQRRFVACFNMLTPDPCARFRVSAGKDPAWRRREFRGFTVFLREK